MRERKIESGSSRQRLSRPASVLKALNRAIDGLVELLDDEDMAVIARAHQKLFDLGTPAAERLDSALKRWVSSWYRDMMLYTLYELRFKAPAVADGAFSRVLRLTCRSDMQRWAQAFIVQLRPYAVQ
jgi:hypothetical protein